MKPETTGMKGFTIIWAGQLVSLIGTSMTNFALTLWAWEKTGQATSIALIQLSFFAPTILVSPLAGALVDRWNRKLVMMFSDLAAGLGTISIFILLIGNVLEIWHLYVIMAFMGAFQSFQFPAYSAAVTTMLRKENYSRASGMLGMAQSASNILGPIAAGILLGFIRNTGILLLDIISFIVAISALMVVPVPQPKFSEERNEKASLLEDSVFGFHYIIKRPSLLGLQIILLFINFVSSLCFPLLAPMILSRTNNDSMIYATVQSAFGIGGIVGGLLLSVWGGPKRRVNGLLLGLMCSCLFGFTLMSIGKDVMIWSLAAFIILFLNPFINGSSQSIWQSKVPPEIQGRVFSTRALIAQISAPIAMALAGPLTDGFLSPAMMPEGSLAPIFGKLVGTGPGAGPALLFMLMGVTGGLISLLGYSIPAIRNVEDLIPDHNYSETPPISA